MRGSEESKNPPSCPLSEQTVLPSAPFCRAIPAWASALQVASTTPMSPMTLASLLPRSSLVERLPWTGGWGEVAWRQGWGEQGQDGDEGKRAAWQADPFLLEPKGGRGGEGKEGGMGEGVEGRRQGVMPLGLPPQGE